MTPYEFGLNLGNAYQQKEAGLGSVLAGKAMQAGKSLMQGGSAINTGAKKLVRGFGNVASGAGHVANAAGTAAQMAGRAGVQGGQRLTAVGDMAAKNMGRMGGGVTQDVLHTVGHTSRLAGRASNLVGSAANMAGKGLSAAGSGLQRVADMGYGVPTVAAGGLLAGTAMAAKPFVPDVSIQNPVNMKFKAPSVDFNMRSPVSVKW